MLNGWIQDVDFEPSKISIKRFEIRRDRGGQKFHKCMYVLVFLDLELMFRYLDEGGGRD